MSSIDERVVRMEFDNKQFESGVDQTMKSLDALNRSLEFQNGTDRFKALESAIKDVDFSHMSDAIDNINARFSALGIIGMRVLQNITDSAMQLASSGLSKVTGFVYEGLITRGLSRAQNIENARFAMQGLLKDTSAVAAIMDDVDWSVQNTAYGLDESALAASQFAASGLRAGDSMRHALRGIAGVAAMTNSEYSDIANIFTTVSGNGRLMGEQLLQLSSRGLNAAAILGEQLGKSESEIREMVSKGQISFEMFSEAMYEAFGDHATDAQKTLTGSFANARAAFAQIGQKFFAPFLAEESALVKFFQEVRTQVRKVRDGIDDFAKFVTGRGLGAIAAVVAKMQALAFTADDVHAFFDRVITIWKEWETSLFLIGKNLALVGSSIKTNLIDPFVSAASVWIKNRGIKLPWTPLIDFLKNFTPATALSAFEKLSTTLVTFFKQIRPTSRELKLFGDIFEGVFSAVDIGEMALSGIAEGFKSLLSYLTPYVGPIASKLLEFFAGIGRAITKLRDVIAENDDIKNFFSNLADWLGPKLQSAIAAVVGLGSGIVGFFTDFSTTIQNVYNAIAPIAKSIFDPIIDGVKNLFASITASDVNALSGLVGAGGIMGIFKMLYDFRAHIVRGDWSWDFVFSDVLTNTLNRLRSALNEWQQDLKANEVIKIAAAIGLLALALKLLASIDVVGLTVGLNALTGLIIELFGAMSLFNGFNSTKMDINGFVKAWGGIKGGELRGIIKFASAILILTIALKSLAKLNPEQAAQGVAAIGAVMLELAGTMRLMNGINTKKAKGFIAISVAMLAMSHVVKTLGGLAPENALQGILSLGAILLELAAVMKIMDKVNTKKAGGFIALSIAVAILSRAVQTFGAMQPDAMLRGLFSVASLIAVLAVAIRTLDKTKIGSVGPAVIGFAAAIYILSKAAKSMGELNDDSFKKGLIGVATLIGSFAIFAQVVGGSSLTASTAAGVLIMAASIAILADVVRSFGGMGLDKIGTGLVALGGSVAVMVAALVVLGTYSAGMLAGAAAVAVMAIALRIFVPVIEALAGLDMGSIVKALIGLAGALALLAGGLFVISVLAPSLLAAAAAVAAIGAAFFVFGAGLSIASVGLFAFVGALAGSAETIVASAGIISAAITTLITSIILAMVNSTVMLLSALDTVIHDIGQFILNNIPYILSVIGELILSVLSMATSFIPQLVAVVSQFVVSLLQALITWLPVIAQTLIVGVVTLINSVANGIRDNSENILAAVRNILSSIIELVLTALADIVRMIPGVGDTLAGMIESGKDSVRQTLAPESFGDMAGKAMDSAVKGMERGGTDLSEVASDAGSKTHEGFIEGLGGSEGISEEFVGPILDGLQGHEADFSTAGMSDVQSYMDGFSNGGSGASSDALLQSVLGGLQGHEGEFSSAGAFDAESFVSGFGDSSASTAASALVSTAVSGLDSKKTDFSTAGTQSASKFADALGRGNAYSKGKTLASSGASGAGSKRSAYSSAGTDMASGFNYGIASPYALSLARSAGARLGRTALDGVKGAIRSGSPSRETMKLGKYTSQGFAIGIKSLTNLVYDESASVGQNAIDGIRDSLSEVSKHLDDDLSFDPTIRPVMDLSEIQNGLTNMNRIVENGVPSPMVGVGIDPYASMMMRSMMSLPGFGNPSSSNVSETTYNLYIDGAKINDDIEIRNVVIDTFNILERKGAMNIGRR